MTQKIIRTALEGRLNTWAAAQTPAVPVAFENIAYTPTNGARYIRVRMVPAETANPTMATDHRRLIGLMQVDIVVPIGNGMGAAETLAEAIVAQFPRGLSLIQSGKKIHIDQSPSIGPALVENGWSFVPVSVRYRLDTFE